MIYNKVTSIIDTLEKMLSNEDKHDLILNFLNVSYPEVKKSLLIQDIKNCSNCGLYACNHAVFEGPMKADIMLVGEAPDEHEEQQGKAFVGLAGEILDAMLNAAKEKINPRWERDNLFITNVIKCRPKDGNNPRPAGHNEVAVCKKFIDKEIEIVKPKIIICMGELPANTLIHPNFNMLEEHGKFFGDDVKLIALHHPSVIIKSGIDSPQGKQMKIEMWNDLQVIENYLSELKEEQLTY